MRSLSAAGQMERSPDGGARLSYRCIGTGQRHGAGPCPKRPVADCRPSDEGSQRRRRIRTLRAEPGFRSMYFPGMAGLPPARRRQPHTPAAAVGNGIGQDDVNRDGVGQDGRERFRTARRETKDHALHAWVPARSPPGRSSTAAGEIAVSRRCRNAGWRVHRQ